MPVKIAYINHTGLTSGAEVSLLTMLGQLDRTQYDPILIAPKGGRLAEKAAELNVPFLTLGEGQFFEKPKAATLLHFIWSFLGTVWQLSRIFARHKVELIHANSIRAGLVTVLAGLLCGRSGRVLVHVRDIPDSSVWLQRLSIWWLGLLARQLICISEFIAERVESELPSHLSRQKLKVRACFKRVKVVSFRDGN